jgi:hypothetical protein
MEQKVSNHSPKNRKQRGNETILFFLNESENGAMFSCKKAMEMEFQFEYKIPFLMSICSNVPN